MLKRETIIRQLLARHNINVYVIVAIPEGKILPGSTSSDVIMSMSGHIITPISIYSFWFDWENGAYTLGEEDGNWEELSYDDLSSDEADFFYKIQQELGEQSL